MKFPAEELTQDFDVVTICVNDRVDEVAIRGTSVYVLVNGCEYSYAGEISGKNPISKLLGGSA